MTVPSSWEPTPDGWLAPSECGWHFVPRNGDRPACLTCRALATHTLRTAEDHRTRLFYPDDKDPA